MSFKREGNDSSLLGTLRKRRIKELFTEDIPEDEAKLLCNGRFTCTVCSSRPIFDTVSMLVVHRSGKKHVANLEIFMEKKRELKRLIAQRRHEQFLKDGTTSIRVAPSNHSGILTGAPYDPCVKKTKFRADERKQKVNLDPATPTANHLHFNDFLDKQNPSSSCSSSDAADMPGNKSHWREMSRLQMSGPVKHDRQLKNIFEIKTEEPVRISPYQSKHGQSFSRSIVDSFGLSSLQKCNLKTTNVKELESSQITFPESSTHVKPNLISTHVISNGQRRKPARRKNASLTVGLKKPEQSTPTCEEGSSKSSVAQKLRQLQGSGWKRDWDGKWIKDENAEFDSDEEPPDIL